MPAKNVSLLVNISIEANSVDPDQTAPVGAVRSGSTLFVKEASNISADDKGLINVSSVYILPGFS